MIDAVGMEAHGSPRGKAAQAAVGLLPDAVAQPLIDRFAIDRLDALHTAVKAVRRGGTVSLSGVYGGEMDPMPMMEMFDRGIQLRMGQCHVKRWIDEIMPLVLDDADPLGTETLATHLLPLEEAAHGYEHLPEEGGRLREGAAAAVSARADVARHGRARDRCLQRHRARHRPAAGPARRRGWSSPRARAQALAEVERDCAGQGATVLVVPTDVADTAAVEALFAAAVERFGRVDAVVHSAAVVAYGRLEDVPDEVFDHALDVNLARHRPRRPDGAAPVPRPRAAAGSCWSGPCWARSRRRT